MSAAPGKPIPAACGDWAAAKAAYRFFDNPRVTEHSVLAGHFAATAARVAASEGPILILQDTTEFIYSRAQPGKIGFTKTINAGRYKAGQPNVLTLCGVLMHSSLAVTPSGTPFHHSVWRRRSSGHERSSRERSRSSGTSIPRACRSRRRRATAGWRTCASPSRSLGRRSAACMWVTGRATSTSSIAPAQDLGTSFLVRVQTNRLAERPADAAPHDPDHRVFAQLAAAPWRDVIALRSIRTRRPGCK
ncbi:transposase DNA-binding-containing protein [Mesorhizobium sp. M0159]|uniref:IS4/Tn5 family transposase DNA-binding protein n=1 Tax=Mesorhizobium sp. M0159 TaxID=2956900 RepID=UPI003334B21D